MILTNFQRLSRGPRAILRKPAWVAVASLLAVLPANAATDAISMADRINTQRAIEQLYWEHRIWPSENPGPKPAWADVQSDGSIRGRVENVLAKTRALRERWSEAVDSSRLQAEIARMARETRDPDRLRELFAAAGNDPVRIAEVIARPLLVDRLIRRRYADDALIHAPTRELAKAARQRAMEGIAFAELNASVGHIRWVRRGPGALADTDIELGEEEWVSAIDRLTSLLGGSTGLSGISQIEESDGCVRIMRVTRVLPDSIELETASWPKLPFDEWWAAHKKEYPSEAVHPLNEPVSVPAIPGSGCTDDSWSSMPYVPDPRRTASFVWTGSELIVWGGLNSSLLETGGIYDPATGSWRPTGYAGAYPGPGGRSAVWTGVEMILWAAGGGSRFDPVTSIWTATGLSAGQPSVRSGHSAVWTGTEMIIWGGYSNAEGYINSGARYSPATDSWIPMNAGAGTPPGRSSHTAVWTGSRMIVWGGLAPETNTGGIYDPVADLWQATSVGANVPSARYYHTAVWSGSRMIVWGGYVAGMTTNTGARFDPVSNSWQPTSLGASVPSARQYHTAVIAGSRMIVWGGTGTTGPVSTGGVYDVAADSWAATSSGANVPTGRQEHVAVWTGTEMIVWGGEGQFAKLADGARYDPVLDAWHPFVLAEYLPSPRGQHTAIWTGAEMIIWGESGTEGPDTGNRYDPATNSWTTISTANEPSSRFGHQAIWTGLEMIVWGSGEFPTNTGGRYNPQLDSWAATSVGANVPVAREFNTLVWTGTEMLVWGGDNGSTYLLTGARYRPDLDSWIPMGSVGAPTARHKHTSVWTGSEMIVWGGFPPLGGADTGGRYDPVSDSWTPTSTVGPVAEPRYEHTAVWTGSEMIVWGGLLGFLNTGGRYDPVTDTWVQTSTGSGVPLPRRYHTAIWTGKEMIVWGGVASSGSAHMSGGRYDPVADAWMPTSFDANTPPGRVAHSAVWTGAQMIIWGGGAGLGTSMGGEYCAGPCTTPAMVPALSVTIGVLPGETFLSWQPVPGATGYDVVKGALGNLRSSGGDFATSTSACVTANNSGEATVAWDIPPAGEGAWYLVRAVNCGAGSYDSGAASQAGLRDAEIQASTGACQ